MIKSPNRVLPEKYYFCDVAQTIEKIDLRQIPSVFVNFICSVMYHAKIKLIRLLDRFKSSLDAPFFLNAL